MRIEILANAVEDYIANGMQIVEIAKKYNLSSWAVQIAISMYFGTGYRKLQSAKRQFRKENIGKKLTNITNLKEVYEQTRTSNR